MTTAKQDEVSAAQDALAAEAARVAEARRDVEKIAAELGAANPDEDIFATLVAKRDTARARLELLSVREEQARAQLEAARTASAAAEQRARAAQLVELEGQIAQADAAITSEVLAFNAHLGERLAALRLLMEQVGQLDPKWSAKPRGTRWAAATPADAMLIAADATGATAAGAMRVLR